MNMDKIAKLREMIAQSNRIVFFGGAGVSTESNIPDFRSAEGLYQEKYYYINYLCFEIITVFLFFEK